MKWKVMKSIRTGTPSVKAYVQAIKAGQHVTPSAEGWQVKKSNASKATKHFSTQKGAIDYARNIAINQQTELFVHGKKGQIRERSSFGTDTFPPKG